MVKLSLNLNSFLDDYIKNKRHKDSRHATFSENEYFASSSGHCLFQNQLHRILKREIPIEKTRRFEIGNIIHNLLQSLIKERFLQALIEKEVIFTLKMSDDEIKIHGWADAVLPELIVEIKSINDINRVSAAPLYPNVQQLHIYMYGLKKLSGNIIYAQASDLKLREFPISFNSEVFDKTMTEFKVLHYCEKEGIPAPRTIGEDCILCLYTNECLNNKLFSEILKEKKNCRRNQ